MSLPAWFERLSLEQKRKYLKDHPNSKLNEKPMKRSDIIRAEKSKIGARKLDLIKKRKAKEKASFAELPANEQSKLLRAAAKRAEKDLKIATHHNKNLVGQLAKRNKKTQKLENRLKAEVTQTVKKIDRANKVLEKAKRVAPSKIARVKSSPTLTNKATKKVNPDAPTKSIRISHRG